MSFTLPIFNVTYDLWRPPNAPPAAPDVFAAPCQLYVFSKGPADVDPTNVDTFVPPIYLRVPKGTDVRVNDIIECQPGSGFRYIVRWAERVHLGFVNEYFTALLEQGTGTPPPPGGGVLMEGTGFVLTETGGHVLME